MMIYLFRFNINNLNKISKVNIHQTIRSRSIFDPFKPKNIKNEIQKNIKETKKFDLSINQEARTRQKIPKQSVLENYRNKYSIPFDARLIYIRPNELTTITIIHAAKGISLVLLGFMIYILVSCGFDEVKIREKIGKQENEETEKGEFMVGFSMATFLIFATLYVSYRMQKSLVLRIFHDEVKQEFYLMKITGLLKLNSEKFTKNDIIYRFDPARGLKKAKNMLEIITRNFGNFIINNKPREIDVRYISEENLKYLVGERVSTLLKLSRPFK